MKQIKVVFDTNALISVFVFKGFSSKVFEYAVLHQKITLSNWILNELQDKLINKFKLNKTDSDVIIQLLKKRVEVVEPKNEIPSICGDKDDNNILQLAAYINAKYIVTGDKDLLVLKKFRETLILSPREFFEDNISP